MRKVIAAGALLTLATGCAGAGASSAPSSTPTPTPPADGGAVNSPADIMLKAGSALPCSDAEPGTPTGAKAQTRCDGGEIVIRVYADHGGIDRQVELLHMGGAWLLTGENWSINAPRATLEGARARLGGKLIHVKCTSTCS